MTVKENRPLLGILGGLGPMSTAYFYEMITEHTLAKCDQDHIDIVISSAATTPDRTSFIIGESSESPLNRMISDAKKLVDFGCDVIAIPCNTAHYFYDGLQEQISVPIINIIRETVKYCSALKTKKIGIMATDGTISTNTYQKIASEYGIECMIPSYDNQKKVMDVIYKCVKQGKKADMSAFNEVSLELRSLGCERVILGCTELSLVKKQEKLGAYFIDALEVLTYRTIKFCQKTPIGFEEFCDAD